MKKFVLVIFLFSSIFFIFNLLADSVFASANLQFSAMQICYNGSIAKTVDRYCFQGWNTANWRFRYRIKNIGNKVEYGYVCYSDIASAGVGSLVYGCQINFPVKVNPNSYIDVNDTRTLSFCGRGMFFGISKSSRESPYIFMDREWATYYGSCLNLR